MLIKDRSRRLLSFIYLYRALIVCCIITGLIIIVGTMYGLVFQTRSSVNFPVNVSQSNAEQSRGQIFNGIGQMRISLAEGDSALVILSVLFVYYPDDIAFTEELIQRIGDFRAIIANYIGSFSVTDLQNQHEDNIKAELLKRFNSVLRLGQIEVMYFSDFMIL